MKTIQKTKEPQYLQLFEGGISFFPFRIEFWSFFWRVEFLFFTLTLSTAMKFASKFFRKWSFFDLNQQPLHSVEPFERIIRALLKAQCPYKFSSFLHLTNGSSRFRLFARDFRRFRFFCWGSACFSKLPPPGNLQSWVKYYRKLKVLKTILHIPRGWHAIDKIETSIRLIKFDCRDLRARKKERERRKKTCLGAAIFKR